MQLIWITGSTSQVRKINITGRGLAKIGGVVAFAFVLLGVGIFRVAIQFNPAIAREMGGAITLQEKNAMEASYRIRLHDLQLRLAQVSERTIELKALKDRFADLATPASVKTKVIGGQGGPLKPLIFYQESKKSLEKDLDYTLDSSVSLHQGLQQLEESWRNQYQWLSDLPTGSPIANQMSLSSNFGTRIDPISKTLAQHPGIDFSAPTGTLIHASGNGMVLRATFDPAYGQFIEISHAEGFVSKYAHAHKLHVQPGQVVKRGQVIAEVGTTGRSTGPHLHYEIARNGRLLNPMQILILASRPSTEKVSD